ncbi:MAG: flagellar biosynthetic protein FliO [Planctomycetota bacterium]
MTESKRPIATQTMATRTNSSHSKTCLSLGAMCLGLMAANSVLAQSAVTPLGPNPSVAAPIPVNVVERASIRLNEPSSAPTPLGNAHTEQSVSRDLVATPLVASDPNQKSSTSSSSAPIVTVTTSLAIVLGLFAGLVWASRKWGRAGRRTVDSQMVDVLGGVPLDAKTKLSFVRIGRRVVVLAQSSGTVSAVSEITDPEEVQEFLAGANASAQQAFSETLHEMGRERTRDGFVDQIDSPSVGSAEPPRRLFATA